MLSLLILLQLQFNEPTCLQMKPYVNFALLDKFKYEGQGIPNLVYCEGE